MMDHSQVQFMAELSDHEFIVNTKPFQITLKKKRNGWLTWQMNAIRYRFLNAVWSTASEAAIVESTQDYCRLLLSDPDGVQFNLSLWLNGEQIRIELDCDHGQVEWVAVELLAQAEEHYMGFGERFDSIDQRGKEIDLWVEDGALAGLTYIPIPFYTSTAGYGIHIDTDYRCIVRAATRDDPSVVSIRHAAPFLNMTLLTGETPKEILTQYTAIAGRPEVPPDWVFGPWKSRDWQTADQNGIMEDIEQQLVLDLPATVKIVDARWENAYHTFEFDPQKFPDPHQMIKDIHQHGGRLVLWVSPWMAVDNENDPNDYFYDSVKQGYLVKNAAGEVYISQMGLNPMLIGSCIDFTNPEAVAWWQEKIHSLAKMGVSGFNTDFGEQIPEDAVFYDGRTGREMHNVYPRLYNQLTFEAMQVDQPGMLLARAGWHGCQGLSSIWAGDQTSDFSLFTGMRSAMIAGVTAGLSGFPYWSCDIGGYFGTPSDEVYMRWVQLGAFSPIMMVHGAGMREPWNFSEQTLSVYRRYAQLHTDLFPYIHAYAWHASRTGIPIMRAMALEFPDDPGIWDELTEYQYSFGGELLVAPVYYGFSRTRPVYLPEGLWCDYWSGDLQKGGHVVNCRAMVDQIPIFVKAGAIIPYLDPSPQTLIPTSLPGVTQASDDLRVDIYPGADGKFELSDSTLFIWEDSSREFSIANSPVNRQVSVRLVQETPAALAFAESQNESVQVHKGNLGGDLSYMRVEVGHQLVTLKWE